MTVGCRFNELHSNADSLAYAHHRSFNQMTDAEFLRTHDAGSVATHDTPEWLEAQARLEEGDADWQKRMEQLEALGYLEER